MIIDTDGKMIDVENGVNYRDQSSKVTSTIQFSSLEAAQLERLEEFVYTYGPCKRVEMADGENVVATLGNGSRVTITPLGRVVY